MPIEEVKDMTWAEFQLRSFQYWEDRKHKMFLHRESAYWAYCSCFVFSKEKPKPKEVFWPIEQGEARISDEALEHFKKVREEYLKSKE